MPKSVIVFNPMADRGRASQRAADLRPIVEQLGGATWAATNHPGHATEIVKQYAAEGYDRVIALGGDGTIHEVVNGLMAVPPPQRPQLGLVPCGTGNDFAACLGISFNPATALQNIWAGQPHPIDTVSIKDGTGRHEYFNNTCGIGFDGAVNIRTHQITYVRGFLIYFIGVVQTILRNFEAPFMKVVHDGGIIEQPILMLTVGNGPREGGGFRTTPDAKPDDGQLDFVYIHQVSQFRMLQLIPKVMSGTHPKERDITIKRTTRLVIDSDRALPIHLDGELFAPYEANVRHVEIVLHPHAIQVVY